MTVRPAPKPAKRKRAPRAWNSTLPAVARTKDAPKKPRKAVARSNRKRRQSAFKRAYLSVEYVKFVQERFCAVCGVGGYSQAAHTKGEEKKGMGQKTSWRTIAPLCGVRPLYAYDVRVGVMYDGCHTRYDQRADFREQYAARIRAAITALHSDWQSRAARAG